MKNFYTLKGQVLIVLLLNAFFLLRSQSTPPAVNYIQPINVDGRNLNTTLYVGTLAGSADVTPTGGANYTIPITIPPGTVGMEPQLAVVYNSQAGNGQLGMSWDLAGLSAITRVGKSLYYDNITAGVELDTTDRFALDGARLIKLTGPYYGAPGSEYSTESETFNKVTSFGTTGNGPMWFQVKTKDGKIIEYGNTLESRVEVIGTQSIYLWRINRITDHNGNYILFHYVKDSEGESRLTKIEYTGNDAAGLTPYNTIDFIYGLKTDKVNFFIKGKKLSQKTLLTQIIVKSESTITRTYLFNYSFGLYQSRLVEVIEKGSDGSQKNSTIIAWGETAPDHYNFNSLNSSHQFKQFYPVDINLDGKTDLLMITKNSDTGSWNQWHLYINQGGWATFTKINFGSLPSNFKEVIIADANHDGIDDVLFQVEVSINYNCNCRPCDGRIEVIGEEIDGEIDDLNSQPPPENECCDICSYTVTRLLFYQFQNGTGLVRGNSSFDIEFYWGALTIHPGDFNGDGKTDFLSLRSDKNFGGIKGFTYAGGLNFDTPNDVFVVDTDGIGKNEIFIRKGRDYKFYRYNGKTNYFELVFSGTFPNLVDQISLGDFNGDGKTDFFVRLRIAPFLFKWFIYHSNGLGFDIPVESTNFISSKNFTIADYNGDGKDDLINLTVNEANTITLRVYYSNDYGSFYISVAENHPIITNNIRGMLAFDLWGDGKKTLLIHDLTIYARFFSYKKGEKKNLVQAILNGFNIKHSFEYASIANTDINTYKKQSGATFPVMDAQIPLYVVKTMKASHPLEGVVLHKTFYYEGLKLHRQGKGLLGFTKVIAIDLITGFRTISEFEYDNTFYNVSLKRQITGLNSGATISEASYTNNLINLGNKRFLPYVSQTVEKDWLNNNTVTSSYQYDNHGNPVSINQSFNDAGSTTTTNVFVTAGGWGIPNKLAESTVTNNLPGQPSFSRKSSFAYDPKGNLLTQKSDPGKSKEVTATYTYNNVGLPTKVVSSASGLTSRVTDFEYDSKLRFQIKVKNALGHEVSSQYDHKTGNRTSETAVNGKVTTFNYDGFGRLTTTVTPRNTITQSVAWNSSLSKSLYAITTTPTVGGYSRAFYDALGREIRRETPGFNSYVYSNTYYNNKGQVVSTELPYYAGETPKTNSFTYDQYGRATSESFNSLVTSFAYTPNKTTVTNPAGQVSSKEFNSRGHMLKATDQGGTITYEYHSSGQVKKITAMGSVTEMNYDEYGMQTSLYDPNAGIINYSYNAYGELISQTDANNNTFTMQYDVLGRIIGKTGQEGITSYSYIPSGNGIGQLLSVTAPNNISENYEYNDFGGLLKIIEVIDAESFVTSFEYDQFGRNLSCTYPSGFKINKTFNTRGFLSQTISSGPNGVGWALVSANSIGQPLEIFTFNGWRTYYAYDNHNLPLSIKTGTVQDDRYVFDPYTGNLQSRRNHLKNLTETFTYDNLNRLTGVNNSAAPMNLVYEPNGNIISKTGTGEYNYHPGKLHAVTGITNNPGSIPNINQLITYTSFNKTASIEEGPYKLVFTYGPDNQRKKSKLYENNNLVATKYYIGNYEKEIRNGIVKETHYVSGPTGLSAIYVKESNTVTNYYLLKDHLGSITGILNSSGSVIQLMSYDAWGRRRNPNDWTYNNIGQNFLIDRGYTFHEHHDAFGLINMNGRMYDPVLGRVLSPDNYVQMPDFTQNFNRYSYAWNNPLKYTDPDGEFIHLIIGAVIGGTINVISNAGNIDNFWEGLGYFGIGAAAGALGAGVGVGIQTASAGASFWAGFVGSSQGISTILSAGYTSSFMTGAAVGAGAGFAGGFTTGFGNGLMQGQKFGDALWNGSIAGLFAGASGAILGGLAGGIDAAADRRNFWHGGRKTLDVSLPIPQGNQVGQYGCNYECAEQVDSYYGRGRSDSYFQSIEPGSTGLGLTKAEIGRMYGNAGYGARPIVVDLNNPSNTLTDISNAMSNRNPVVLNYNTGVSGGVTSSGQRIVFGHATVLNRLRLYDNGRFVINVMNPSSGLTRFTSLRLIYLLFSVH